MKKNVLTCLAFSIIFSIISTGVVSAKKPSSKTIETKDIKNPTLSDSFEGSLSSIWTTELANSKYSGSVSDKYSSSGKSSYRIELRKTDQIVKDSKRAEIHVSSEGPLEEHTYTFSILLPKGGDEDYKLDPEGSEIIAQWHNKPDKGEDWTSPPLALRTKNGRYIIERWWDDAEITTNAQMLKKGNFASYDLGSYENDKGKFVEWKFHIKWGWLASQKPILEVYKDGVKILDCNGQPNTTNDKEGNCLKLGIYKWDWAQVGENDSSILTRRVIYYDNIKIQ